MDSIDRLLERPSLGHNQPPKDLSEELAQETESFAERAMLAIFSYERCEVVDDETSQKAVLLIGQMKQLIEEIESARIKRGEPFHKDWKTVNAHFQAILAPLGDPADRKRGAAGDLLARIDTYRRKKDAEIEATRLQLEEEARLEQETADRAAAILQQGGVSKEEFDQADLMRRRAEDNEAKLRAQVAATVARPIDSGYGVKASARKGPPTITITDLDAAINHCRVLDASGLTAYVMGVYQRQARAGVRVLPGATIKENITTAIRRK